MVNGLLVYLPGHQWWSLELLSEHQNTRNGMGDSGMFDLLVVGFDDTGASV